MQLGPREWIYWVRQAFYVVCNLHTTYYTQESLLGLWSFITVSCNNRIRIQLYIYTRHSIINLVHNVFQLLHWISSQTRTWLEVVVLRRHYCSSASDHHFTKNSAKSFVWSIDIRPCRPHLNNTKYLKQGSSNHFRPDMNKYHMQIRSLTIYLCYRHSW